LADSLIRAFMLLLDESLPDGAVVLDVAQPGACQVRAAADINALQDWEALQQR
jgi:hypothetical protein